MSVRSSFRNDVAENTTTRKACHSCRYLDLYGEPVQLTFKQQSKYKTTIGATISIFCISMMICFFIVRTQKLNSKEDPFFAMMPMALD